LLEFQNRSNDRSLKIGVIGLGYVGLPLAVEFARAGFNVLGFEVDKGKIQSINTGRNYIPDVDDGLLAKLVSDGKLAATAEFPRLAECDSVSICVPTPLSKTQEPDISYILSATEQLAKHIKPGALVVLESTTYPGTTEEVMLPLLSKKSRKVGKDFFLAFSPERVDPGNPVYGTGNTPKVIGGVTPECVSRASCLYGTIISKIVPVSSTMAAEMVKLVENTFRAINIASVNEIAMSCHRLGLDVWEVINAASTKPFGFVPFYPGPGLGGHCIPIDPLYLSWKMRSLNFRTRFIELANEINREMPMWVVERIADILNDRSMHIRGTDILVLGVAYKKDINDVRESPALEVMELLIDRGANVYYHDPHVPECKLWEVSGKPVTMRSVELTPKNISSAGLVVCTTDHSAFDWAFILNHAVQVFDTRNATKGIVNEKIVRL